MTLLSENVLSWCHVKVQAAECSVLTQSQASQETETKLKMSVVRSDVSERYNVQPKEGVTDNYLINISYEPNLHLIYILSV